MKVAKVIGIPELNAKLKALANRSLVQDTGAVIVGYTQHYAIYVHEIPMRHKEGKFWKYLETPFRTLAPQIPTIVETVYRYSSSLLKGLLVAGLRIQRDSMKIVPIDTGALRASAFTSTERGAAAAVAGSMKRASVATLRAQQKREKGKKEKSSKSGSKKGPVSSSRRWRRNTGGL